MESKQLIDLLGEVNFETEAPAVYSVHPAANAFPMMKDTAWQEFLEDVKENGVLEPVIYMTGDNGFIELLDGRNRMAAAKQLGIGFQSREYLGDDPVGFVVSRNLRRRQLTDQQRASVAATIAQMPRGRPRKSFTDGFKADVEAEIAKNSTGDNCEKPDTTKTKGPIRTFSENEEPSGSRISNAEAAEMLNVSERSVKRARAVHREGAPELVEAMNQDEVPLSTAEQIAKLPKEEQVELLSKADPKALKEAARMVRSDNDREKRERRRKTAELMAVINKDAPISERKYGVIYADPPWRFKAYSEAGEDRSPENHYVTMTTDDIASLPVEDIALDDCVLLMWATFPMLQDALHVIEAWGFTYKTCGFTWVKVDEDNNPFIGMGYWTRSNAEICLLATKGNPMRMSRLVQQVIMAPRGRHSEKPMEAYERIEELVTGPYMELFARERRREWWDFWGNELLPEEPADAAQEPDGEEAA
jgi:N6-adenosine-specific RNA methylase IME4